MIASFWKILSALFLFSVVHATTWMPNKFAVTSTPKSISGDGATVYFYSNGTIQELGVYYNVASPTGFNRWKVRTNFASPPTSITNVAPASDFAAVGYNTGSGGNNGLKLRVFYQALNGDIRSVWYSGLQWALDPTVIANVPLGSPISAYQLSDTAGKIVIVVQYTDASGVLTQRLSNTVEGNWGTAVAVNT